MGFFFSSLLVTVIERVTKKAWLRNNLNEGKLDYFYWLLMVLGVLNFLVFVVFVMRHQYKVVHKVIGSSNCEGKELNNPNDGNGEFKGKVEP